MKIGLLSDTHSVLPEAALRYMQTCDEIWHAGDIGSLEITKQLSSYKPLRAVFGNIDQPNIRNLYPRYHVFNCAGLKVLMTHIAGKHPHYNPFTQQLIAQHQPQLLVCGHTHILHIARTPTGLLYMNPGAIGNHGIHLKRTMIRFEILQGKASRVQVIELGDRGV
ncbi:MAG: metallophosphoesterase family protein [Cytophagales bacterium]